MRNALLASIVFVGCGGGGGRAPDGGTSATATSGTAGGGFGAFRVWAPNATAVSAVGGFGTAVLTADDGGYWTGAAPRAASGQTYQFSIQSGGQTLTRTDPAAAQVGTDPGKMEPLGVLYDQSAYAWSSGAFVPAPRSQAVIYELHVGTFNDPTGNGLGTYQSAAAKLDDLAKLGVNYIELMPVTEFPGSYSWGYDPIYAYAPCRAYGSPDDLKALVDQAHQLGLGVILDMVFNHFGLDSRTSPSLSMWCFDGPCTGGGIFFSPEPSTPWGPRPAFGTPGVHDFILGALASWLSNFRVDGFRWDSTVNIRSTGNPSSWLTDGARLLKDANLAIHAENPKALSIAEDLQGWDTITAPADPATVGQYDAGYGFDGQWDDGFFSTVKPLLTANADSSRDVTTLPGTLTASPAMTRVVFTEDHDQVAPQNGANNQRIPALIGLDANGYYAEKRSSLGIALVLTAPAIPMLFMGQEFLETLPFPFGPGAAVDWTNEQTYGGFRQLVHDLIALRENTAGHTAGLTGNHTQILESSNATSGGTTPTIAYRRWAQGGVGDDTIVVANFCNKALSFAIGLPAAGAWHVRFSSDDPAYSSVFGGSSDADVQATGGPLENQGQSGTVTVGAYSVVILSQ